MDTTSEDKREDEPMWDCSTGIQNLLRNRVSGRYYTRVSVGGKRMMRSLKTTVLSVAKQRHADEIAKTLRQRRCIVDLEMGVANMGTLIDKFEKDYLADKAKSQSARNNTRTTFVRLTKHWRKFFSADLRAMKPSRITQDQVRRFANYLHSDARHQQNKSKRERKGYSAVAVNRTIELLHRVLRLAVEIGATAVVPFELTPVSGEAIRKPEIAKKIVLPTTAQMRAIFAEMRRVPDAWNLAEMQDHLRRRGGESAEFAEFMAFSGARLGEASVFVWEDDLPDVVMIRGTKTESSRDREVPKIPALRDVLEKMRARRMAEGRELKGRVFNIKNCRQAIDAASERLKVPRVTHHGLRHFFATICIEAGVDIPTVSRWLGHADGGALAMRTYGHLRREHSLAAAARVQVA